MNDSAREASREISTKGVLFLLFRRSTRTYLVLPLRLGADLFLPSGHLDGQLDMWNRTIGKLFPGFELLGSSIPE